MSSPRLHTEFACTARVALGEPIVLGAGPEGLRRFVPILGGTVSGPLLQGIVLPAGGDSQLVRADEVLAVEARYVIESSDGVRIGVTNRGLRHGPAALIARMNQGETVDPSDYYFRTLAQFEAPLGSAQDWVNKTVFVGTAERQSAAAIIHFFRIL
jgi:hypothetical protein